MPHGHPLSCSTVDTDLFPELKTALAHSLPLDADLTQGVQVTIADRFGAGATRTFPIDDPARPSLAPPRTAPAPDQPGVVEFDPELTAVQVPVQVAVNPNYELARIVPAATNRADELRHHRPRRRAAEVERRIRG